VLLKVKSRRWVGSGFLPPPRTTPRNALYGRCVCCTRESCVFVMWIKTPRSLDSFPYSAERKETQRNLFTFPKCQDKLGGLRVSAQSSRQLLYKKSVRVDFSFARPLASPEETAAPPPRKTWTSLPPLGRAGPALGGTHSLPPP
jgi:hypothetical protein